MSIIYDAEIDRYVVYFFGEIIARFTKEDMAKNFVNNN